MAENATADDSPFSTSAQDKPVELGLHLSESEPLLSESSLHNVHYTAGTVQGAWQKGKGKVNHSQSEETQSGDNTGGSLNETRYSSHKNSIFGFQLKDVSLSLENSGSVARDHLASERTFLAYMRTSLAIAASGVALFQLFSSASVRDSHGISLKFHPYIRPLGSATVAIGLIILLIGVTRYFSVQTSLVKGTFPVARLTPALISIMLSVLVTLTFGILLAGKSEVGKG